MTIKDDKKMQAIVRSLSLFLLILGVLGTIASLLIDVEFIEKYGVKRELREQSKMGVTILKQQLVIESIVIGIVGLLSFIYYNRVAEFCRRRKKLLQNLAVLIVMILILCVFGEIILRLFFADKLYGEYGFGPGYLKLAEKVTLNSYGYRDVEHTFEKDEGMKRILIIGDSMTYGAGVESVDDIYGRVLQRKLDDAYGSSYEVIILAQPGYSTFDELRVLHDLGLRFDPDIVILAYQLNDAEGPRSRQGFESLYFRHYFYPYAIGGWLYQHSLFFYFFESRMKNLIRLAGLETATYGDYIKHLYVPNDFLEQHQKALAAFVRLGKSNGAQVVVMDIPTLVDSENYPFSAAITYVGNVTTAHGAYYFTLLPVLSEYEPSELRVSFLDGHLNKRGQALAGEALFVYLEKNDLIGK